MYIRAPRIELGTYCVLGSRHNQLDQARVSFIFIYARVCVCVRMCRYIDYIFSPEIDKFKIVMRKGKKVVIYAILFYCRTSEEAIIKLFGATQNLWAKKSKICVCMCVYE